MTPLFVIAILFSLLFAFFFSAMESAYRTANKLQIELEGRLGKLTGRILSFFVNHPAPFVGTTLVGSTVSLVIFTALLTIVLLPVIHTGLPNFINNAFIIIFIQCLSAAIIILVIAGILPRLLAIANPNAVLSALAVPFYLCFLVLFPLTYPLIALSRFFIVRVFRMKYDERRPFFASPEIHTDLEPSVIPQAEDTILDKNIFYNALEFKTVKIRDCMIPRTEITAVELNDTIEKLRELFVESGHSKVIIYKQSIDEIIGYCHSSSLFKRPDEIREILTPIIIVAETTSANELMIRFLRERKSMAVVIDEFGGTAGIVSMEDIIEEIFGKVDDERDEEDERIEQKIDDVTYLLSARLEIDYLNETYGWGLPTGEYESLGGLILAYTEDFPQQGETVSIPPFSFTILATGNNRIDTVKINLEGRSMLSKRDI
ncbi:MAG: hemolysin family protein [Chryseolinea sp.]